MRHNAFEHRKSWVRRFGYRKMVHWSAVVMPLIPDRFRIVLRAAHRRYVFSKAMRRFLQFPANALSSQSSTLDDLIYGWGNEAWSAQKEYLIASLDNAISAKGAILECGSGLSTVLIGAVTKPIGKAVWTLEHAPEWAARVETCLKKYGLTNVTISVNSLKNYGNFDWYQVPLCEMPCDFGLVICDGPPGGTKGGRYGMLPVMRENLSASCVVLLDDAEREREVETAKKWCKEFGMRMDTYGTEKLYIVMARNSAAPDPA